MHESLRLTASTIPRLDDPLVISAFWGRGDRTGSATQAVRTLQEAWGATELATIDPDRFYDLTVTRPRVRPSDAGPIIRWPGTRFHVARAPGTGHDVVLLAGREPHLHWVEYAQLVAEFMQAVGARRFLTLGSRPSYVPHTRPSPLLLVDADPELERLFAVDVEPARMEGPANLQTVVMLHLRTLGMSAARLIALTPSYISGGAQPRAMLALIEELDRALGSTTTLDAIRDAIPAFEQQVGSSGNDIEDMRTKLRELEEQYDASFGDDGGPTELPDADELMRGIEQLLRAHSTDEQAGTGPDPGKK